MTTTTSSRPTSSRLREQARRGDQIGRIAAWLLATHGAPEDRIADPDRPVAFDRGDTAVAAMLDDASANPQVQRMLRWRLAHRRC